jgi:hypothetical protein
MTLLISIYTLPLAPAFALSPLPQTGSSPYPLLLTPLLKRVHATERFHSDGVQTDLIIATAG